MNRSDIELRVKELAPWYHSIPIACDDGGEVITPGQPYEKIWDNIRKVREGITYRMRNVLDLATFDGMWAFEAESLGAAQIIATDCMWRLNPFFVAQARRSKVIFLLNVPAHELVNRLDCYFAPKEQWSTEANRPFLGDEQFDVVHHLGLLYHLRDPMVSLVQARSVMRENATLLLETAFLRDEQHCVMGFNAPGNRKIYKDPSTWWAPSLPCLKEMLIASCFEMTGEISVYDLGLISRICLIAKATPYYMVQPDLMYELKNTFRTPGLRM